MMVGEARAFRDLDPGIGERREEFLGIAYAGEGENLAGAERRQRAALGFEAPVEDPYAVTARDLEERSGIGRRADHDKGLRARHLHVEGRAQGTGRNHPAVADAATTVDHEDREILDQRRILKAVVHNDDGGAIASRHRCARDALARHDGGREPRQQERLVADIG